jgi:electron transport complex protein RnfD
MPPAWDLVCGAYGGGIGETCAAAILIAGLYLVYRNYIRWQLPGMFLLAAGLVAAVAPIRAGPDGAWRWLPFLQQGADAGIAYVGYHLTTGGMMLAAWFFATEMTSRPVTGPAQAVFGFGCGAAAMIGRLYTGSPIPAYAAVLLMNTFTPVLDNIRPRVFGRGRWGRRR